MVIRTQFKAAVKLLICGLLTALIWQGAVASQAESAVPAFTPITAQNAAQVVPLYTTLIPTSDCLKPAPTMGPEYCTDISLMVSPNGGYAASYTSNDAAQPSLLNVVTHQIQTLPTKGRIVAFTLDSKQSIVDRASMTEFVDLTSNTVGATFIGPFVKIDPTGHYLLTGESTTIMLWRIADNTRLITITNYVPFDWNTKFIVFSPDGHYLAWADVEGHIHLWDIDANMERTQYTLKGVGLLAALEFSPDSSLLAVGTAQAIALLNTSTGAQQTIFKIPADHIAFSPDKKTLILLDIVDRRTNIVDERSGAILNNFTFNDGDLRNLVVDPITPRWFLYDTLGSDYVVAWNPLTMNSIQLPGDAGAWVTRIWFNPSGDLIFLEKRIPSDTGSAEYTEIRDATTWRVLATLAGRGYRLTPDGATLVKSTYRNMIVLGIPGLARQPGAITLSGVSSADIPIHQGPSATSKKIGKLGYYKTGWATGQNNGYVYLANQGGWVRFGGGYFMLNDNFPITYLPSLQPNAAVPFTPTPSTTPQPTVTPTVMLSATPNSPTPTLAPLILPTTIPGTVPPTGTTPISTTDVSQLQLLNVIPIDISKATDLISGDGQTIVELSAKPMVWRLTNPVKGVSLPIKNVDDIIATISPNGQYLAYTYNEQTTINIFNLVTDQAQATITVPESIFREFASDPIPLLFSPNDQYLAIQTPDPQMLDQSIVQNWAVADGHLVSTIQDNQAYVRFNYSADSTALYSVSRLFVHRWNVTTGQKEQIYNTPANSIAISPDTSTLATIAYGAVNIWDTATQHLKQSFYTSGDTMRFSPDGQSLLTPQTIVFNNPHPVVSVWDVSSGKKKAEVPGNDGWFLTNQDWLAFDPVTKALTLYDMTGQALSIISWPCQDTLAHSVDNH